MKLLSPIILSLFLALFLISCEGENTEKFNEKFTLKQTNKITDSNNLASYIFSGEYIYDIDYVKSKMNITAKNVRFNPNTQISATFDLKNIKFTYSDNGINFSATDIIPEMEGDKMEQYSISKLSGRIITKELSTENIPLLKMELMGSVITAYPAPMTFDNNCSTIVIKGTDDTHPYVQNKSSFQIKINEEKSTADIYIYNARFNNDMTEMNMIFKNIEIKSTKDGFSFQKDSLTPNIIDYSEVQTPIDNYLITNVDGIINGDKLELSFNCTINSQSNSQEESTFLVSAFGNILPETK